MKIAVIFDSLHPEWEDAAFKREVEQKAEEAEYDVARALLAGGHDVLMIGIGDDVAPLLAKLADFQPKLVFNGCEGFRKNARHEYAIAALLDMYGYRIGEYRVTREEMARMVPPEPAPYVLTGQFPRKFIWDRPEIQTELGAYLRSLNKSGGNGLTR